MCALLRKKFRSEKGQVLIFTVCMLPLLLGMMALVIEVGNLYIHQSELQQVADAIALTGDESTATAEKIITKNLNTKPFTVTPSFPKSSNADDFCVELTENVPPIFEKVFGNEPFTLVARAASSKSQKKLIPFPAVQQEP